MNEQLVRGGFIALQGAEKSGKSFFLQELVMRAIRSRCKVALFELGDMTREDRLCRFHQYLAQKPLVRTRVESGRVKVRIPELKIDNDIPVVSFREEMREVLTAEEALKNGVKWEKRIGKNRVELVTETSDTLSIVDIDNILEHWQKTKGWVPDVIALDYAELCRPIDPKKSERGQINDTWKAMRRLSQKWDVLLLTVTQSDALAYGITSQTRKNFSEDKRKFAHPTAFYSINQTIQEKAKNMIRIGTLLVREGEDRSHKEVAVLQCLGLGRPYIDSYEVDVDFEKIKQESQ
jgi:archaellum biogenesis ATPase FlaH